MKTNKTITTTGKAYSSTFLVLLCECLGQALLRSWFQEFQSGHWDCLHCLQIPALQSTH